MSYTLIIAEKPDMARAFADFLFKSDEVVKKDKHSITCNDTIITWAYGHILEMAEPEDYDDKFKTWRTYPIFPNPWKLKISGNTSAQFKAIRELLKNAREVIHGGDPDREGQLLVDEILHFCKYTGPVKRLLANAKDNDSLRRAFNNLEDNAKYRSLYEGGLARQRADWLVGMNLSRAYSTNARKFGYNETFKIGRVKTPTLALIVRRELEIENFKPITHYTLDVTCTTKGKTFKAKHNNKEYVDTNGYILDQDIINTVMTAVSTSSMMVKNIENKSVTNFAPLPYSLDTLQVDANKRFGYSPKEVLETIQKLYENAFISYPRSDCNYIPTAQLEDATDILKHVAKIVDTSRCSLDIQSKAFNDKKITAHHAIIPTKVAPVALKDDKEKNLYHLIATRYAIQFMAPETALSTSVHLQAGNETFTATGKTVIDAGWKSIYQEDSEEKEQTLPQLDVDEMVEASYGIKENITKPPKRFTEGTLIKAMANIYQFVSKDNPIREKLKEVKGIGTPATRDTIIADLLKTKSGKNEITPFVEKKGKELVPTAWGKQFISIIDDSLTLPDLTAEMEYAISEIVDGSKTLTEYMAYITGLVEKNILQAEHVAYPIPVTKNAKQDSHVKCPICNEGILLKRTAKATKKTFYVCANDCKSPLTGKTQFYKDSNGPVIAHCPSCNTLLIERIGKYGAFWACPNHECGKTFKDKDGRPVLEDKK